MSNEQRNREDPSPDEMIRFVMGDTDEMTPEQRAHLAEVQEVYTAEVQEIFNRVKREMEEAQNSVSD